MPWCLLARARRQTGVKCLSGETGLLVSQRRVARSCSQLAACVCVFEDAELQTFDGCFFFDYCVFVVFVRVFLRQYTRTQDEDAAVQQMTAHEYINQGWR